jgi:hypothetical protein
MLLFCASVVFAGMRLPALSQLPPVFCRGKQNVNILFNADMAG